MFKRRPPTIAGLFFWGDYCKSNWLKITSIDPNNPKNNCWWVDCNDHLLNGSSVKRSLVCSKKHTKGLRLFTQVSKKHIGSRFKRKNENKIKCVINKSQNTQQNKQRGLGKGKNRWPVSTSQILEIHHRGTLETGKRRRLPILVRAHAHRHGAWSDGRNGQLGSSQGPGISTIIYKISEM